MEMGNLRSTNRRKDALSDMNEYDSRRNQEDVEQKSNVLVKETETDAASHEDIKEPSKESNTKSDEQVTTESQKDIHADSTPSVDENETDNVSENGEKVGMKKTDKDEETNHDSQTDGEVSDGELEETEDASDLETSSDEGETSGKVDGAKTEEFSNEGDNNDQVELAHKSDESKEGITHADNVNEDAEVISKTDSLTKKENKDLSKSDNDQDLKTSQPDNFKSAQANALDKLDNENKDGKTDAIAGNDEFISSTAETTTDADSSGGNAATGTHKSPPHKDPAAVRSFPKRPPVPQQESDAAFLGASTNLDKHKVGGSEVGENCGAGISLVQTFRCHAPESVRDHVVFYSFAIVIFTLVALKCFCACICGNKKRDDKGEYRAVALQYGGFDDDNFDDDISHSFADQRSVGSNISDDDTGIEDDWSSGPKGGAVEMKSFHKEVNGGLTLEEMNG
mmetsp:Transcript_21772/g.31260  ORF Transcript_21772/g.31260 Transcript_21772/m.31260 type:complete len:453 (+) Transcript_21772:32-1390(+)